MSCQQYHPTYQPSQRPTEVPKYWLQNKQYIHWEQSTDYPLYCDFHASFSANYTASILLHNLKNLTFSHGGNQARLHLVKTAAHNLEYLHLNQEFWIFSVITDSLRSLQQLSSWKFSLFSSWKFFYALDLPITFLGDCWLYCLDKFPFSTWNMCKWDNQDKDTYGTLLGVAANLLSYDKTLLLFWTSSANAWY